MEEHKNDILWWDRSSWICFLASALFLHMRGLV